MPLISQEVTKERVQMRFRLDKDVVADLEAYCRFLHSGRDFVVENMLTFVFKKDRDFQDWLAANPSARPSNGAADMGATNVAAPAPSPVLRRKATTGDAA